MFGPDSSQRLPPSIDVAPYEKFAEIYDGSLSDGESLHLSGIKGLVVSELLAAFQKNEITSGRVLDLACGTGDNILALLQSNYEVDALDISVSMLAKAQEKIQSASVRFLQQDMHDFVPDCSYVGALCTSFSLTYVTVQRDLESLLKKLAHSMPCKGVLAFDMLTPCGAEEYFGRSPEEESAGHISYRCTSFEMTQDTGLFHLEFQFTESDNDKIFRELHYGKAYRVEEVTEALSNAGFAIEKVIPLGEQDSEIPLSGRYLVLATRR